MTARFFSTIFGLVLVATTHAMPNDDPLHSFTAILETRRGVEAPERVTLSVDGDAYAFRRLKVGVLQGANARGGFALSGRDRERTLVRTVGEERDANVLIEGFSYRFPWTKSFPDRFPRNVSSKGLFPLDPYSTETTLTSDLRFVTRQSLIRNGEPMEVTTVDAWRTFHGVKVPALVTTRRLGEERGPTVQTRLVSLVPKADFTLLNADLGPVTRTVVQDAKARTITTFDARKRVVKVESWEVGGLPQVLPWLAGTLGLAVVIVMRALRGARTRASRGVESGRSVTSEEVTDATRSESSNRLRH